MTIPPEMMQAYIDVKAAFPDAEVSVSATRPAILVTTSGSWQTAREALILLDNRFHVSPSEIERVRAELAPASYELAVVDASELRAGDVVIAPGPVEKVWDVQGYGVLIDGVVVKG